MPAGAWPLCDACTDRRVTQAVATPLDIPALWDDLEKYDDQEHIPTVPTGEPVPLCAVCGQPESGHPGGHGWRDPFGKFVPKAPVKHRRVPTMEERAAWFHHNQTTVAEQVGSGPRSSFLTSLWVLVCRLASKAEMALVRWL
jgi:hypothetical protein